jgi:hypothetical protein
VFTENDDFIAEAPEFNEFGYGKTQSGALKDLQFAISHVYFTLEAEASRLGPELAQTLAALRQRLRRVV